MIAFDLVAVSPMTSMTGNVAYIEYVKGTDKGQSAEGDMTNSIWELGNPDVNYTGAAVVENITSTSAAMALGFKAIADSFDSDGAGTMKDVKIIASDGTVTYADLDSDGKVPAASLVSGGKVAYFYDNVVIPQETLPTLKAKLNNIPLYAKARRIAVERYAA